MKKFLALLSVISILAISFFGCNNFEKTPDNDETMNEQDNLTEPNPASDFKYRVNDIQTGILIEKYIGLSENVVIPSEIDGLPVLTLGGVPYEQNPYAIAEGVFEGSNIKTVVIPKTIILIGYLAFKDCKELTDVKLPSDSNLKEVHGCAFQNCIKLNSIDLSTTKTKIIGSRAFSGCTNLKEIKIPDTLEEIYEHVFFECSSLVDVHLPKNLTKIGKGSFGYCTVVIPAKLDLMVIDDELIFYELPALEQIIFEEGRETITGYAFFDITSNVEIIVPKSVKGFDSFPFFVRSDISVIFLGDCPEIIDESKHFGDPTIYYDPQTSGWDNFAWKDKVKMKPIQEN